MHSSLAVRSGFFFKRAIHSSGKKLYKNGSKVEDYSTQSLSFQNMEGQTSRAGLALQSSWKLFFPRSRYEATTLETVERNFLEALDEQKDSSWNPYESNSFIQSEEYGTADTVSQLGVSMVHSQCFSKRLGSELSRAFDCGSLYNYFGSEEMVHQASPVKNISDTRPKRSPEYWYYYCTYEDNSVKSPLVPGLKVETQAVADRFSADIFSAVERYNQLFSEVQKQSFKYVPEEESDNQSN
ncbi:hypothetical protein Gasu2_64510 [Galdieria sulphuraria]|uniref:Uncharacterized protein n=1 Tax=Galdieria sulphuraria TaxID=130081 RepID=M2Y5C4_GALSU|nr:uncharacterized protein Gasu_16610 [Galdieria sulphuraria]EME31168.1 hypothetical protein Gasu_16610 [Galdieria sulphuraria]GJD12361.1 hypothetical protein Gasu2_64510 [Galdieria sulphuraria]|eukprot:XP_005707688.1 hypothetical protein Gasu_16610 [Galdieria sulphuraria]